jgi:hypothetical protein
VKIPFKPKIYGSFSRLQHFVGRFGLVILMTVAVLLLPRPEGLSESGHHALAAFVFTAAILSLEPVSLPIAALMVPVAEVALGIATTPVWAEWQPFWKGLPVTLATTFGYSLPSASGRMALLASSKWVDRQLSRMVDTLLKRYTKLDVRDYASLLHLTGEYRLAELRVKKMRESVPKIRSMIMCRVIS